MLVVKLQKMQIYSFAVISIVLLLITGVPMATPVDFQTHAFSFLRIKESALKNVSEEKCIQNEQYYLCISQLERYKNLRPKIENILIRSIEIKVKNKLHNYLETELSDTKQIKGIEWVSFKTDSKYIAMAFYKKDQSNFISNK